MRSLITRRYAIVSVIALRTRLFVTGYYRRDVRGPDLPLTTTAPHAPRIRPGTSAEIGRLNFLIARALGAAMGSGPPHIFTTLARHRRLFRRWLRFAGALMPGGRLPRADSELLILRVAHNTGCDYEWAHHERIGQAAGLSGEQVQ